MKYKTTNKELKTAYRLVAVGYCELQNSLQGCRPMAYTSSNIYGWRADIYHFDGFTLATGYSTPPSAIALPYDLCRQLEKDCEGKNHDDRMAALVAAVTAFLATQN